MTTGSSNKTKGTTRRTQNNNTHTRKREHTRKRDRLRALCDRKKACVCVGQCFVSICSLGGRKKVKNTVGCNSAGKLTAPLLRPSVTIMNVGGVHMEEPELKRPRGSKGDDSEDTDGENDHLGGGGGGAAAAGTSAASSTASASANAVEARKPLVEDLRDLIAMNNFISRSSVHSYNNKHAGNRVIKIINGQVLRDHKLVAEDFWVKGDKIIDPMSRFWDAQCTGDLEPEDIVIDAKNCIICPGFIDIQINGAFGVDFSNPGVTSADVDYVAANLVRYGVTAFLPTVVSSQPDVYVCLVFPGHPKKANLRLLLDAVVACFFLLFVEPTPTPPTF